MGSINIEKKTKEILSSFAKKKTELKVIMILLNICVFVLNGHKKNCLNGKEDGMGT